jgi:hypothetical protein
VERQVRRAGSPQPTPLKPCRNAVPITDEVGRVFALGVGMPGDDGQPEECKWLKSMTGLEEVMEEARAQCSFSHKDLHHRRGPFPALAAGVSFGGGQVQPGNLAHRSANRKALRKLLCHPSFIRISKFVNGAFAAWFPKLYTYYHQTLGALYAHDKELERIFPDSAWAAMSFNFGRATCCYRHLDWGNLAYGVCVITNVGKFDSMRGGHLILWECGLVIEFPPGVSIIIPSAIISHSNVPIQPHESRYSFTQYAAGGLFRWAEHGFQKEESYIKGFSAGERAAEAARKAARKDFGVSICCHNYWI